MKNLLPASERNIRFAAEVIRRGGLVAFPTETVYGLGADALNPKAVARVYEVKGRPRFDPLIVHISSADHLSLVVDDVPEDARRLIKEFWPGPLTLVLKKSDRVPPITTAGLPTVAVRMPDHPVALKLIEYSGRPIAAPSANPFGYVSPTSAEQVAETLGERVDVILDAGPTRIGVESTILAVSEGKVLLLRPGGLPVEEVERVLGKRVELPRDGRTVAPGMLKKHYSPRTPLFLIGDWNDYFRLRARYGRVLLLSPKPIWGVEGEVVHLSQRGDVREVAQNLFGILYRIDKLDYPAVAVLPVEEEGLGRAVMNRLRKASVR